MASKGWIGVDLDGTLAEYDRWRGHTHIGKPIQPMVDRIRRWLTTSVEVKIFTARVSGPITEAVEVQQAIWAWLLENGLPQLSVTCVKDYDMLELWDDRAVQVEANTGKVIGRSTRGFE